MSEKVDKRLIGVRNLCEMLDVARTTIYRLKDSGRLPQPLKLGGSVKWRKDEIDAWVDAGCPPVTKWNWEGGQR